MHVTRKE